MAETPAVQGTPEPKPGGGFKGFMKTETAGMPNWVWLIVIAGGIALAIGIKYYSSKKNAGNATTTGTTPDSGLGLAVDPTTGLPYAVEGLVPAGGTVGNGGTPTPTPTPNPTPSPSGFTWPTELQNMKIWQGTRTHQFFFGPYGPQPDEHNQVPLASVFPSGTTFTSTTGKAGSTFFYTLPGTTTPVQAPVTLVDPNPPAISTATMNATWPAGTTQTRVVG